MTNTTLDVHGMSCPSCVHDIRRILGAVNGVGAVAVDLDNGRVEVQHDAQAASRATIEESLREGGYTVGPSSPSRCCCG